MRLPAHKRQFSCGPMDMAKGIKSLTADLAKRVLKNSEEALAQMDRIKPVTIESVDEFTEVGKGGGIITQGELVAERIMLLANATLEEARMLLDLWVRG